MMRENPSTSSDQATKSDKRLLCAKCDRLNKPGAEHCEFCGAHLLITCNNCGARILRTLGRCPECRHHLHRSAISRFRRWVEKRFRHFSLWQAALWLGGVIIVFLFITWLADLNFSH